MATLLCHSLVPHTNLHLQLAESSLFSQFIRSISDNVLLPYRYFSKVVGNSDLYLFSTPLLMKIKPGNIINLSAAKKYSTL